MPRAEPLSEPVAPLPFRPECLHFGAAELVPEREEAGPKARLSALLGCRQGYQLPLEGQPPSPSVVQVRSGAAPSVLVIVNLFPDFECPMSV
jgi:hypothetical protein